MLTQRPVYRPHQLKDDVHAQVVSHRAQLLTPCDQGLLPADEAHQRRADLLHVFLRLRLVIPQRQNEHPAQGHVGREEVEFPLAVIPHGRPVLLLCFRQGVFRNGLKDPRANLLHHGGQQGLLVVEVIIDGALAEAGTLDDAVIRSVVQAILVELLDRRLHQLVAFFELAVKTLTPRG